MFSPILAMAAPPGGAGDANAWLQFTPFLLIMVLFYFLLLRPQQKQRQETEKMRASLKKGDRVVTSSGIVGTLTAIEEKTVEIKVASNVKMTFLKSAVAATANDTLPESAGDNS